MDQMGLILFLAPLHLLVVVTALLGLAAEKMVARVVLAVAEIEQQEALEIRQQ
jgi:hypothetical protein